MPIVGRPSRSNTFQSTPPSREATWGRSRHRATGGRFQSTPPLTGGDLNPHSRQPTPMKSFNPRPPSREATPLAQILLHN